MPHTPFIFDRATNSILPSRAGSYTDELALVDLTLGELRLALEGAGLWDTTALIVTSDHWRRRPGWKRRPRETFPTIGRPDHRVPLILRFPGQREAVLEQRPIHSAAAHTFALAILDGQLQTPAHIEAVVATLPRWIRLDSRQASD